MNLDPRTQADWETAAWNRGRRFAQQMDRRLALFLTRGVFETGGFDDIVKKFLSSSKSPREQLSVLRGEASTQLILAVATDQPRRTILGLYRKASALGFASLANEYEHVSYIRNALEDRGLRPDAGIEKRSRLLLPRIDATIQELRHLRRLVTADHRHASL